MSGPTQDSCIAPQLDLFGITAIDVHATATPKENRAPPNRRAAIASRKSRSASRKAPISARST